MTEERQPSSPAAEERQPRPGGASSAIEEPSSATEARSSTTEEHSLATGEPSLATGEPSLATGEPSLATGEPSLATWEPSLATWEPSLVDEEPPPGPKTPRPGVKTRRPGPFSWFWRAGGRARTAPACCLMGRGNLQLWTRIGAMNQRAAGSTLRFMGSPLYLFDLLTGHEPWSGDIPVAAGQAGVRRQECRLSKRKFMGKRHRRIGSMAEWRLGHNPFAISEISG